MASTHHHRAKHRASTAAPRNGAAALMIGGLVAGTVATAGATTLTQKPDQGPGLAASLNGTVRPSTAEPAPQEVPPAQATLRSASLDELRAQPAADRSEARSAPEDAASVSTLLEDTEFTGTTIEVEVEAPVEEAPAEAEPEQVEAAAAPVEQEQAPVEQAPVQQEPVQQAPVQQTQQAPAQPAAPAPVGGSVLDVAAAYVGYPYVLYGTPPQAFDCSAYTWWVFKQAGIDIPRTVAGQKAAVTPVSDPQPGDLVIYNDWYHIGIYAGNGMTYEALNPSTDVRYGPLLSDNVWYGRIG
ncbi:C40 family peptidase [Ornithinimicrobium pekingense]|uniref:Hydrolase n=1 Tax=Ornithinimicrobium pekingense TaxID=384677 RepID=A0ABQ2F680_9MICO|nr:C40 family peptidase [Ornithinimicrobium pekingense]GGK63821.1 hydrolase [Ornithinimicrobium pekingense]